MVKVYAYSKFLDKKIHFICKLIFDFLGIPTNFIFVNNLTLGLEKGD